MRLLGRGVCCVRGGREVFSGLDFEAASGEALAVTGPNGSGKTSLLRLIAGLLAVSGGMENLAFWRDFLGAGADASDGLAAVGLDHAGQLPAAFLSAGQRRRLSIARLLAVRRPVWLLDEPTNALDTAGQSLFAGIMRDHLARGGLIIAATHAPLGLQAKELRIGGAS